MRIFVSAVGAVLCALILSCVKRASGPGADVQRVFLEAETGAPLRVVLLGGSITQGGHGWIGDWLRRTFPRSAIHLQNSGLGGTGSDLGNFRLRRDVIAYNPQLVFIESCVNDNARPDEDVLRDLESLVVRLRGLPRPPAVVLLIAGQERGLNKSRHQKIAEHYGLPIIDLDASLHEKVAAEKRPWTDFMTDAVHPNESGNQFYAEVIQRELEALRSGGPRADPPRSPVVLSAKPLWMDADLIAVREASGWRAEDVPADWRYRIFPALIGADKPGTTLEFPFWGTAIGLLYPAAPAQGSFYATIDDRVPTLIRGNTHAGYAFRLLADDLSPAKHVLRIVVAEPEPRNRVFRTDGPVKLGFVAVANQHVTSREPDTSLKANTFDRLRFEPIPAAQLAWAGPFGSDDGKTRYRAPMDPAFGPEVTLKSGALSSSTSWKSVKTKDGESLGFSNLEGGKAGVFYVGTRIDVGGPTALLLRSTITGSKKIWVNGQPQPIVSREVESDQPIILRIALRAGGNEILWKVGTIKGEARFSASFYVPKGERVEFALPR